MILTMQQTGEWETCGESGDPAARLLARVEIAGTPHHMEAIAVCYINDAGKKVDLDGDDYRPGEVYHQIAADEEWQEMLDEYYNAAGGDGSWRTVEINGREYVICITPYCQ